MTGRALFCWRSARWVACGAREHAAFVYDATWLAAADRFALEPNLPLFTGSQFHRKTVEGSVFHAAIADTEPDGWGRRVILRDQAKRRSSALNPPTRRNTATRKSWMLSA